MHVDVQLTVQEVKPCSCFFVGQRILFANFFKTKRQKGFSHSLNGTKSWGVLTNRGTPASSRKFFSNVNVFLLSKISSKDAAQYKYKAVDTLIVMYVGYLT